MKTLKLINYKTHRGHDGCNGFNADIVYKGVKIAHVYDSAYGGCYEYNALASKGYDDPKYKENRKMLDALMSKAKQLPKVQTEYGELDNDLDLVISELINQLNIKKDEKKGVLVKSTRHSGWEIVGFKTSIPTTIKKWSDGLDAIQKIYDEQKKEDAKILNKEYLQTVGVIL